MLERARIDRRLRVEPAAAELPVDAVVVFRDGWGEVAQRYDLGNLELPSDVTLLLADAFRHHHAGSTHDTRRHCWQALRVFARFARDEVGVRSTHDLTTAMVGQYIGWLDRQRGKTGEAWSRSSRANTLMQLRQLVEWTKRCRPRRLPSRIDFPYRAYPNRQAESRSRLSAEQLKVILRACYEEIDEAWERFEAGRTILFAAAPVDGVDPELCDLIRGIAAIEGGVLPPQRTVVAQGIGIAAVTRHGGLRLLSTYLHLTGETLVPYFIVMAIQMAANPDALRRLPRDCQVAHPLDENRIIIDWAKPRAGAKMKRAQRRSFDRRRKYAVPNLVDQVLAMTAPLAAQARLQDRHWLFLVKSEKTRGVALVQEGTLMKGIKAFISRANARIAIWNKAAPERPRAPVPDFAATFLRGSVATEHYVASGGDILVAQHVLNHARVDTTEIYIKGPEARRVQRETIARLQGLMIGWITGQDRAVGSQWDAERVRLGDRATTPFGHDCLNPLAGTAPNVAAVRVCPNFGGCLRCPGLVIPVDAEHLARLLQAKGKLECARDRLDPRRWELLYAPSYRILVDDILPDFPDALRPLAEAHLLTLAPLPALE